MIIHSRVVIDIESNRVIENKSCEYNGALCLLEPLTAFFGLAASGAVTGGAAAGSGIAAGGGMAASAIGSSSAVLASEAAAAAATYGGLTLGQWASLGSTAISTASQMSQASASASQDSAMARSAIAAARLDENADRRRSQAIMAKQQAGAAAAGLDIGSGTPLELLMDSAFNAEMNALNIRKQGRMESDFYKTRARNSKASIPGLAFQGLASGFSSIYGKK